VISYLLLVISYWEEGAFLARALGVRQPAAAFTSAACCGELLNCECIANIRIHLVNPSTPSQEAAAVQGSSSPITNIKSLFLLTSHSAPHHSPRGVDGALLL
jgi:hypothetical protein